MSKTSPFLMSNACAAPEACAPNASVGRSNAPPEQASATEAAIPAFTNSLLEVLISLFLSASTTAWLDFSVLSAQLLQINLRLPYFRRLHHLFPRHFVAL